MENSNLNGSILMEIENLISKGCADQKNIQIVSEPTRSHFKKCYNLWTL